MKFQSTLPRGERRSRELLHPLAVQCFNPRSRAGSDLKKGELKLSDQVSIHAPARGATYIPIGCTSLTMFQSTLPRGERLVIPAIISASIFVSIHAPARGATWEFRHGPTKVLGFQSTLPRGERRTVKSLGHWAISVSIHAPARGATNC